MDTRIIGFDLARAYAIFGMFIVNFNFCFGSIWETTDLLGRFLNLFVGNSTAIFIILAGAGLSLLSSKSNGNKGMAKDIRNVVLKRSWFLFTLGLLLYTWWPGDILHFYGGYMHIAAFLLFASNRQLMISAIFAILVFHALLLIIPVETGWDFTKFQPVDFWTPTGFLRNTFYNGWNSIFPWIAYFFLGMWIGRLQWADKKVKKRIFILGLALFVTFQLLRILAKQQLFNDFVTGYIMSEYFPPYLPFMFITAGFAMMVISLLYVVGEKAKDHKIIRGLSQTGRMTLTHYVLHLTIGMLMLSQLTNLEYTANVQSGMHASPLFILIFTVAYCLITVLFSVVWSKYYKHGPLESIMRKFSN